MLFKGFRVLGASFPTSVRVPMAVAGPGLVHKPQPSLLLASSPLTIVGFRAYGWSGFSGSVFVCLGV